MNESNPSRREFLLATGAGAALWLGGDPESWGEAGRAAPKAETGRQVAYQVFSPEEAEDVDAISAQIVPGDSQLPGASEARAVVFIDRALATFQANRKDAFLEGLADLNRRAGGRFARLSDERQRAILREIDGDSFFGMVYFGVLTGTFAHPNWGGNHEEAGWRILGFESRRSWQPPFGEYDAEVSR
jgi:hypothetical protein